MTHLIEDDEAMPPPRWSAGDLIFLATLRGDLVREIVAVRETGYAWRFPAGNGRVFDSENSNDPYLRHRWKKIGTATA